MCNILHLASLTSRYEIVDGRDCFAGILYLLRTYCQLATCEAVKSTNKDSLFELHVCIGRGILLTCGLVVVLIHPPSYFVSIRLKNVFLSK